MFRAALLQFYQGQVRLLLDPLAQRFFVGAQEGPAVAADRLGPAMVAAPLLLPEPRQANAVHPETSADFARAFAMFPRHNDAPPQILT